MTKEIIICDIDNTLLFTNSLNNESYIESTKKMGIKLPNRILKEPRITSAKIKEYIPSLDDELLGKLQKKKLAYFLKHVNKIVINKELVKKIYKNNNYLCLWTSATKERAIKECEILNIEYDEIIFLDKEKMSAEEIDGIIRQLLQKYNLPKENLIVYDDERIFLDKIRRLGYKTQLIMAK